jgi:peptidoglycan hydrolase CwlO-like protein
MLKKLVIVGIVGFVAVAAVKGSKFGSYIRSEYEALKARAEANIPPEQEIKRLRNEIKQLDKDILAVVGQLARERVEVANLKEKADELRARQSKDKELLSARAQAIKNAVKPDDEGKKTEFVTFGNRKLSVDAAKAELEDGVRRYTTNEKSLVAMDTAVGSREKVKETLEKQLETLKNQKGELAAAVDALEAEVTALKLHQMESKYQTDDTRLGQIKEDIRALKTKIEIEREKLKLLPAVLDNPSKATSNRSVDDIMAPIAGASAKTGESTMPIIE